MYTVHSRLTQDMLKYKLWIGTVCALQPGAGYMFLYVLFKDASKPMVCE